MLTPTASVSVAKTTLSRPAMKHCSTASLNAGTIPAWCGATPASSCVRSSPYPSTARSRLVEPAEPLVDDRRDRVALGCRGEPDPGRDDAAGGLLALVSAEDEEDRRAAGCGRPGARSSRAGSACRAPAGRCPRSGRRPYDPRPRTAAASILLASGIRVALDERRQEVEPVVGAIADEIVIVEPHRSPGLDHRRRRPADGLDPRRQLGRVAHRRRQAHQPDVLGQVDDHLLPHRSAVRILEEVHLVEHDEAEVVERP